MSAHTSGPWHRNIKAGGKYPTVFAGRNQHVAVVSRQDSPEEIEANIDLIAAASELLDALRNMIDWLDDGNRQLSDSCAADVAKARAAIAKVTGAA